jgi:hypothetical protein
MIGRQAGSANGIEVDRAAWGYYGSLYKGSYKWLALCMLASFLQAIVRRIVSINYTEKCAQESQTI